MLGPTTAQAVSDLRSTIWADTGDNHALPAQVRHALSHPDVHQVAARQANSNIGIAGLVRLARSGHGLATLALYLRYVQHIAVESARFTASPRLTAMDAADAHQVGALALIDLVHDDSVPPTRVQRNMPLVIRKAISTAVHNAGRFGSSAPLASRYRIRRALAACDGNPTAAARWAATAPPPGERMSAEVFWASYMAFFAPEESLDDAHDTTPDHAASDDMAAVENRIMVQQLFGWGILDKREEDILRRSLLFAGERETDEQIALDHNITRSRVVQIRTQALAALRTEFEQEGLTSAV